MRTCTTHGSAYRLQRLRFGPEATATHFSALVITPHRPDEGEMERVLWPWCDDNPDALDPMFDYFRIGGSFEGALDPEWTHEGCKPVRDSSQKRKGDLDLAALRRRAAEHKASLYDRIEATLAGRQIPDIDRLTHRYGVEGGRKCFDADPAVKAVRSMVGFLWTENIVQLSRPREDVLARARRLAPITRAVVSGGEWHASGLFNEDEDPARTEAWVEVSERLIAKAAPDDWITIVDCHC